MNIKPYLISVLAICLVACEPAPTSSSASVPISASETVANVQAASMASEVVATERGDVAALVALLATFEQEIAQNGRQSANIQDAAQVQAAALKEIAFYQAQTKRLAALTLDGRAAQLRDKLVRSRQLSAQAMTILLTQASAHSDPKITQQLEQSNRLQTEVWQDLQTLRASAAQ